MARRRLIPFAAVAVLAACGCIREHIEVTILPRPDGTFVRHVRLWKSDTDKKDEVLAPSAELAAACAKHYKGRLEPVGEAVEFKGAFSKVPPDIHHEGETNHGSYDVWRSSLGHMAAYRERRPGRIDLWARFQEADKALGLLVKFTATMARQELKGEEGLDRLVAYLEGPLRRDLKEIAFHLYLARLGAIGRPDENSEDSERRTMAVLALAVQYAEERGLVKLKDLAKLAGEDSAKEFLMGLVAQRMGRPLDAALRKRLAAFAEGEKADGAAERARKALKISKEELEKALEGLNQATIGFELFESNTTLRYALRLPAAAQVLHTSGRPDKEKGEIIWEGALEGRPIANIFFALWTVPDAPAQTRCLGRVVLRDRTLQDYIVWESNLDARRAAAWRAALGKFDPKGNLVGQLSAIHLTPPKLGEKPGLEEGASIIIQALGGKAPEREPVKVPEEI